MNRKWVWAVAACIVLSGVGVGLFTRPAQDRFRQGNLNDTVIVPKNDPGIIGFKGDLQTGGHLENNGAVYPFVIGDILKLEAEAVNATEYRWQVNGKTIKEKGAEWSPVPARDFELTQAGEYAFSVQVRGADPQNASMAKEKLLRTEKLLIQSFEPHLIEPEGDRRLTGEEYSMVVYMVNPTVADNEFYKFRYLVNDQPVRHPDTEDDEAEEGEWCNESDFRYTFPAPGTYSFKVEVRRAESKEAEASKEFEMPIIVADAILSDFDARPEKYAPLGTLVDLNVSNESRSGKSEVRFGVKKITAADYDWLPDENGAAWGDSQRSWRPMETGTYLVRAEVREAGKEQAEDYREFRYTVTEEGF